MHLNGKSFNSKVRSQVSVLRTIGPLVLFPGLMTFARGI